MQNGECMRNNSSSLRRALTILDSVAAIAGRSKGASLGELAEEIERVIELGLPPRTAPTITDPDELRRHLDVIRAHGYSYDDIENEEGIRCVAAPVFNHAGVCVCAMSVSGPADRMDAHRREY